MQKRENKAAGSSEAKRLPRVGQESPAASVHVNALAAVIKGNVNAAEAVVRMQQFGYPVLVFERMGQQIWLVADGPFGRVTTDAPNGNYVACIMAAAKLLDERDLLARREAV